MAQKWRVTPGRVASVVALLWLVIWVSGKAVEWAEFAPWPEAQSIYRKNPAVAASPVDLPNRGVAPLSGVTAYLFGFQIQTPWKRLGTIREQSNVDYIPFPEENVTLAFFMPDSDSFARQMWAEEQGRDPYSRVVTSDYELFATILSATPDQVKWWRTNKQNEASSLLLEMKSQIVGGQKAIYRIEANGFHGFQEGDPAAPPYSVRLDLFDSADEHYELVISPDDRRQALTQPQLNAMIASLRSQGGK